MKNIHLSILLLFVLSTLSAQSRIIESISMESELLKDSIKYSVYLPEGFENSKDKFPVVYLLNGFTGNETNWHRIGLLQAIADELIRGNKIEPMVIIMPDGDDRLYMNKDDGTYPYEDMLITEFLPFVENKYNIKGDKQHRGISGLSMGGAGSLRLALKYHNLFGACAAYSSGILTDEEIVNAPQKNFDNYFARISPRTVGVEGKKRLTDAIKEYNIFSLIQTKDVNELKTVNIYFDCGDDDFLAIGNSMLHVEMLKKKIPHEYRVRDGAHTWNFWVDSLPHGLEFISDSMRK